MIIYLLRDRHTKIGITDNLGQRLREIRRDSPRARVFMCFSFIYKRKTVRKIEAALHRRYDHLRRPRSGSGGTEWFAVYPLRPAFWLLLAWLRQLLLIFLLTSLLLCAIYIALLSAK